jgi:Putative beta-barrel porin 2
MTSRCIRAAGLAALLTLGLAFEPPLALAFTSVDTMLWPSSGAFPAYPGIDPRPWSLRAYGGVMYDDNVVRLPEGFEVSDTISRLGVGGSYAARVYGRQAVVLDGYVEYRDYDKLNNLDHTAYGTRAEWLWELGNQLNGTAGWRRTVRLADLGETVLPRRDLLTEDRLDVTGLYRFAPDWRVTGGAGLIHIEHDGRDIEATNAWASRLGIEHVSGLGNTAGVEVRYGEGDAAVDAEFIGFFPNNRYKQREIAGTLAYGLTADMRVRGRLGYTTRTYTDLAAEDFEGTTGRGAIEWRPGVKTLMLFEVFRQVDPIIDADALHVDRRGALVGLSWAPTVKLVFGARFTHERRIYEGVPGQVLLAGPLRDETLRFISFTAGWEPERFWQISAAVDFGNRESNIIFRDYDYTAYTLNLKYEFR